MVAGAEAGAETETEAETEADIGEGSGNRRFGANADEKDTDARTN